MGIRERKMRERDEKRALILQAAAEVIGAEGTENLSVRKIAAAIEYSPAIIYHYFENKDQIVEELFKEKYAEVGRVFSTIEGDTPEAMLRDGLKKYIDWSLQCGAQFKHMQTSEQPGLLALTSLLSPGVAEKRLSFGLLAGLMGKIMNERFAEKAELTAQVVWAWTYGLIIRIIMEKVPEEQRRRLIERHLDLVIQGLKEIKLD